MYYLIENFGYFKGWLLAWTFITVRYAIFAGIPFLIFYAWKKRGKWLPKKIQKKTPANKEVFREISYSLLTLFILSFSLILLYQARKAGYTLLYTDVFEYGLWYIPFSFAVVIFGHDTYFYWLHRLMHSNKKIYRLVHLVHHRSYNPTPWTSFSFHPIEAIIEIGVLPFMVLLLPLHPIVLIAFSIWSLAWNVFGHLGYEFFPKNIIRHPIGKYLNTSTHHNMHHEKVHCNYGLYFNIWDRIMNTNDEKYFERFDSLTQNA